MESLTAASKLIAEYKLHEALPKGQLEQILESLIETGSTDLALNIAKLRKDDQKLLVKICLRKKGRTKTAIKVFKNFELEIEDFPELLDQTSYDACFFFITQF